MRERLIMQNSFQITGYNFVASLLVPVIALFLPLVFDDNVIKIFAVALGAFIGGVGVDYIRPEKTLWRNTRKILCSSIFAVPPSFAIAKYYAVTEWEYVLCLGFLNGLIAIILITVILAIADDHLKNIVTKWLFREIKTTEIIKIEEKE